MGSGVTNYGQHSESILTYLDHSTGALLAARGVLSLKLNSLIPLLRYNIGCVVDFWHNSGPVLYPLVYTLAFIYNLNFTV